MKKPKPVNVLQYLKPEHIEESQKLQMGYYRDLIWQYGLEVKYFKHNTKGPVNPDYNREDVVRGENPHLEYLTSAEIRAYVQADNSIITMNSLGLAANDNFKISFLINEFNFAFSEYYGEVQTLQIDESLSALISGGVATIDYEYVNSDNWMSGAISAEIENIPSGENTLSANISFYQYDTAPVINELLYLRNYYDAIKIHSDNIELLYSSDTNGEGDGSLTAQLSGQIQYTKYSDFDDFRKDIRPEVGDIVRITIGGKFEDLEITQVLDRRPTTAGLNPLLDRYIFELDAVRREVSYEDFVGETPSSETSVPTDIVDRELNSYEEISNNEFDYTNELIDEIDGEKSDRLFGGY